MRHFVKHWFSLQKHISSLCGFCFVFCFNISIKLDYPTPDSFWDRKGPVQEWPDKNHKDPLLVCSAILGPSSHSGSSAHFAISEPHVVKFHLSLKEVQAGNVCWGNEWERRHGNLSVHYALEVVWDARGRLLNEAHPPITGSSVSHGAEKPTPRLWQEVLATWHTWCFGNTRREIHPVREVDGWAMEGGNEQRPDTKMYAP